MATVFVNKAREGKILIELSDDSIHGWVTLLETAQSEISRRIDKMSEDSLSRIEKDHVDSITECMDDIADSLRVIDLVIDNSESDADCVFYFAT